MNLVEQLKQFFKKINHTTPFEKRYLFEADVKSSLCLSIIIIFLELGMIISAFTIKSVDSEVRDFIWLIKHVGAYVFFLCVSIGILIYSSLYLKNKTKSRALGEILKIIFSLSSYAFALYMCYIGNDKSGITFVFITISVYVLTIYIWKPVFCFLIATASFAGFFIIQIIRGSMSYSIQVNAFTAYVMLLVSGLNIYLQRRTEARQEEELWDASELLREKNIRDELTGLHNMSYFNHKTEIILKSPYTDYSSLCFAFMDIENFKNYNEKYGFKKGNQFLVSASKIIAATFDDALLARFSDDHFVVLAKYEGIEKKMAYIREILHDEEESVNLGLKVGIYRPKSPDCQSAISCDYARYASNVIKKKYNNDFIEYDDKMDDELKKKQYVINNIEKAVENKYIKVFYQPVIWAKNSKLSSMEALARWEDPEYGMLSPAVFIPVLEEYHLIHKLDLFVMKTVCEDMAEIKAKDGVEIPVSINLSRLDFDTANPMEELENCIKTYNIDKSKIHIEITESSLSDNDEKFKSALESFRNQGYSLWLDDFGSGYSGLNVLKDFNFDMMKIDMNFLNSFSENKKTQSILESIVELANRIGMNTLTEGVETQEAFDFLKSIGCQRLQGYLFGKPMPKALFMENIQKGVYDISDL